MHEFSLAQNVLEIVRQAALQNAISRVVEVRLEVGRISGVSTDALLFAWQFVRDSDELVKQAEMVLTEPAGEGECNACGYRGPVEHYIRICPSCGAPGLVITAGEEFMVTGISGE